MSSRKKLNFLGAEENNYSDVASLSLALFIRISSRKLRYTSGKKEGIANVLEESYGKKENWK